MKERKKNYLLQVLGSAEQGCKQRRIRRTPGRSEDERTHSPIFTAALSFSRNASRSVLESNPSRKYLESAEGTNGVENRFRRFRSKRGEEGQQEEDFITRRPHKRHVHARYRTVPWRRRVRFCCGRLDEDGDLCGGEPGRNSLELLHEREVDPHANCSSRRNGLLTVRLAATATTSTAAVVEFFLHPEQPVRRDHRRPVQMRLHIAVVEVRLLHLHVGSKKRNEHDNEPGI